MKRSVLKRTGNEIGGAEMVVLKKRDPWHTTSISDLELLAYFCKLVQLTMLATKYFRSQLYLLVAKFPLLVAKNIAKFYPLV